MHRLLKIHKLFFYNLMWLLFFSHWVWSLVRTFLSFKRPHFSTLMYQVLFFKWTQKHCNSERPNATARQTHKTCPLSTLYGCIREWKNWDIWTKTFVQKGSQIQKPQHMLINAAVVPVKERKDTKAKLRPWAHRHVMLILKDKLSKNFFKSQWNQGGKKSQVYGLRCHPAVWIYIFVFS